MFKSSMLLIFFAACNVYGNATSTCGQKSATTSYLDTAMDMISKAKDNVATCNIFPGMLKPMDCAEVLQAGHTKSLIYKIWPINRVAEGNSLHVYCDMDTDEGGWTLIQRRGDFNRSKDYFYKDWKSYKDGFGDVEEDFWLGNENIYALTNQKLYSVRFDLMDVEQEKRYAVYDKFWIDSEKLNYTLHISDYSGDAGDSMWTLDNEMFSTKDKDNDKKNNINCAVLHKGGWWYHKCHKANLNGLYHKGKHTSYADGVNWLSFKGYHDSLEWTEIKIRPLNFRHTQVSDVTSM